MDAIYRLSYAILGDEADARDATQETFVSRLARARANSASRPKFDAWLQRTARSTPPGWCFRGRGRRRIREIPPEPGSKRWPRSCRPPFLRQRPAGAALRTLPVDQRAILGAPSSRWTDSVADSAEVLGDSRRNGQVPTAHRATRAPGLALAQPPRVRSVTDHEPWDDERLDAAWSARSAHAPTPSDLPDAVMAQLRSPGRRSAPTWRVLLPIAAAIAVAVVLVRPSPLATPIASSPSTIEPTASQTLTTPSPSTFAGSLPIVTVAELLDRSGFDPSARGGGRPRQHAVLAGRLRLRAQS